VIIKKKFTLKTIAKCLSNTLVTTAMSLLIISGAVYFGNFMAIARVPATLQQIVSGLDVHRYVIILIIFAVYLVLGCFMDGLAIMFLTVPIFLPVVRDLGFSSVWFGVFLTMACQIGFMTPPVGLNAYVVAGIVKDVPLSTVFKGNLPFVAAAAVTVVMVMFFPAVAEWLPTLLYG